MYNTLLGPKPSQSDLIHSGIWVEIDTYVQPAQLQVEEEAFQLENMAAAKEFVACNNPLHVQDLQPPFLMLLALPNLQSQDNQCTSSRFNPKIISVLHQDSIPR